MKLPALVPLCSEVAYVMVAHGYYRTSSVGSSNQYSCTRTILREGQQFVHLAVKQLVAYHLAGTGPGEIQLEGIPTLKKPLLFYMKDGYVLAKEGLDCLKGIMQQFIMNTVC